MDLCTASLFLIPVHHHVCCFLLNIDTSYKTQSSLSCLCSKGKCKGVCIAIYGNPSHNYGVSLAIWDHTVLPATRHKRTHPAFYPSQTGSYSIYRPFKDGGLSKPRSRVQRATGPRLLLSVVVTLSNASEFIIKLNTFSNLIS